MGKKLKGLLLALVLCLQVVVPATKADAATVLYNNATGTEGAYNYELWKDYGDTSMTLKGNGLFECWWENIGNALFRKGIKWDCTKTYSQLGNITVNYGVDYQPNGNSYLCVYGWCRNPLVEYYIVDSWGTWRPPGATSKGTITVDGGTYDVYETTRVNQPSIDGNTTFQQYWSVRTSKRTSGTISVTEHFKAWENMGMQMGLMYEAALTVEGYQSSGWADVYQLDITVGGSSSSGSSSSGSSSSGSSNSSAPGTNTGTTIECENMTKSGQYTGTISNPFNGVALYGNDDAVSTTVNFTSGTHSFSLRGASNGDELAEADLYIGGEKKGTFYYGDANTAEYTIENVSHGTGNQKVEIRMTADTGAWDLYADCLIISGSDASAGSSSSGSSSSGSSSSGSSSSGSSSSGSSSSSTTNTGSTMECENMTKSGQYTGNISSPFSGVALYANDDAVSYTQNFTSSTNSFTLTGASNNDNMAQVDLYIGNEKKGTFYYGDANVADYVIENVSTGTGNQTVKLVVSTDDGQWDAYLDKLTINGGSSSSGSTSSGTTSGSNTSSGTTSGGTTSGGNTSSGTVSTSNSKECEDMTKSGQYTGNISSPFNGVALYANDDAVSYTQYFSEGSHDFTLKGASNGDNMAKVDLVIGGSTVGTFYYGDANVAEYTISNVSHGTGNQTVKLVVTADDGQWDAYIDSLTISAAGSVSNGNSSSSGSSSSGSSSINPNGKMIALTFDDGPSSTTTQVLDILDKYDVKATFFLIGQNINSNTRSILERQNASGHELANHSYTHSDMTTMSWSAIQNEINQTNSLIQQYTGQTPKFFRPPYISVNSTMYSAIDMAFIQGSMHNDWDGSSSSSQIANSVISSASDGQIILLHDFNGNSATVQALPTIIENLKNQGYQFVTLSQMFQYKGKNANVENKIWSNVNN